MSAKEHVLSCNRSYDQLDRVFRFRNFSLHFQKSWFSYSFLTVHTGVYDRNNFVCYVMGNFHLWILTFTWHFRVVFFFFLGGGGGVGGGGGGFFCFFCQIAFSYFIYSFWLLFKESGAWVYILGYLRRGVYSTSSAYSKRGTYLRS